MTVVVAKPSETCTVFVYGSLKRGQANHTQLNEAHFLGEVRTAARFALRLIDGYPALVAGASAIFGELFQIDTADLERLDAFEGDGYVRAPIKLEDGAIAFAYFSSTPERGAAIAQRIGQTEQSSRQ